MEIVLAQAKSRGETIETMRLATTYTLMFTPVILASGSDSRLLVVPVQRIFFNLMFI